MNFDNFYDLLGPFHKRFCNPEIVARSVSTQEEAMLKQDCTCYWHYKHPQQGGLSHKSVTLSFDTHTLQWCSEQL